MGEMQEDERPDLVGVIVDEGLTQIFQVMWGDTARCVREVWEGASESATASALISRLTAASIVFLKTPDGLSRQC